MLCTSKHRRCDTTALIRTIPETFKGLGLSQQVAFGSTKAMFAGITLVPADSVDALWVYSIA